MNVKQIAKNLSERYKGSTAIAEHRPDNLTETSYALNKQFIKFYLN